MKNKSTYESVEEMEKCRNIAIVKVEKLYNKLGFVVLEAVEDIRLKGMSATQRRNYFMRKCSGGSSY